MVKTEVLGTKLENSIFQNIFLISVTAANFVANRQPFNFCCNTYFQKPMHLVFQYCKYCSILVVQGLFKVC